MKLVIFSDIHYAPEPPVNNGSIIDRKLTQYSIPIIKKLIDKINNSLKPDLVVNLGDLIEDFNEHHKDIKNIAYIWNILKDIKVPFYSAIGNHDLRSLINDESLKKIMGYDNLPCVLFTHFGVAEDDMKGNWWFENTKENAFITNRKEIKNILEKDNNIVAVFSGHQHWTKTIIENNIPYYVLGSLTEDIKGDGVPDGVYFEVDLNQKKLKITEHHIKLD